MSALGHSRTSPPHFRMSALPSKADITENRSHVRSVPVADIIEWSISTGGANPLARLSHELPKLFRCGKDHVCSVAHHPSRN